MSLSAIIARLIRDEDGGPLVEVAVILPILITFLFGGVDFLNAFYQWNAAAKAVEVGARIAAVSDPVASGLNTLADNAVGSTVALGSPMPNFEVACDGSSVSCRCVRGACNGMGFYSADAMGLIVYGRSGKSNCGSVRSEYFAGMCDVFQRILPRYVSVVYTQTGLGFAGRGLGPVPTIAVSLNAPWSKAKLPFRFFFLPFPAIEIPSVTTSITGEALSSAAVN
jgi:Flp pilus assembly pilin Flp